MQAVSFLSRPPADGVLVGYARRSQLSWVLSKRRYNLRGDDRLGSVRSTDAMLAAHLILLWTHDESSNAQIVGLFERTGPWQISSAADLTSDGYPTPPAARTYLVTSINPVTSIVDALVAPVEQLSLPADHKPTAATWERLARSGSDS